MSLFPTRVVPVIGAAKELVGVVTDDGLMNYLCGDGTSATDPISKAFAAEYREISADTSLAQLRFILTKEGVAFVTQSLQGKKELLAVVTKNDLCAALVQDKLS
jgi:CBS-domain-containing membrane protein